MAQKQVRSKQEIAVTDLTQTMHKMVKQPNAFVGDHVTAKPIEQAKIFAREYLEPMKDMTRGIVEIRIARDKAEREFERVEANIPGLGTQVAVGAALAGIAPLAMLGANMLWPITIISDRVVSIGDVQVALPRETVDFFRGIAESRNALVGDKNGKTHAERVGAIGIYREAQQKVYKSYGEYIDAVLTGNEGLAEKKANEVKANLEEFKKAEQNLKFALTTVEAYTGSMQDVKMKLTELGIEMAANVVTGLAIGSAMRGISAFYKATSSAGKIAQAVETSINLGEAAGKTAVSAAEAGAATVQAAKAGVEGAVEVGRTSIAASVVPIVPKVAKSTGKVLRTLAEDPSSVWDVGESVYNQSVYNPSSYSEAAGNANASVEEAW